MRKTRDETNEAGSVEAFLALLERCRRQVEADPTGCTENPHLHGILDKVYLRLCHGNKPECAAP